MDQLKKNYGARIKNRMKKCIPQNKRSIKCNNRTQKKNDQIYFKMGLISVPVPRVFDKISKEE